MKTSNILTPTMEGGIPSGPYGEVVQLGLSLGAKLGAIIERGIDIIFDNLENKKEELTW